MSDASHRLSGAELAVGVAEQIGLGYMIGTNETTGLTSIVEYDHIADAAAIGRAMDRELMALWPKVMRVNPERLVVDHDFTYPSGVEYVTVGDDPAPSRMEPPYEGAFMRLVALYDRSDDTRLPVMMPHFTHKEFVRTDGLRWSTRGPHLYVSERYGLPGTSGDRALRLSLVPTPGKIDATDVTAVRWLPVELHQAVILGAALRIASRNQLTIAADIAPEYTAAKNDLLFGLRKTVGKAEFGAYQGPHLGGTTHYGR